MSYKSYANVESYTLKRELGVSNVFYCSVPTERIPLTETSDTTEFTCSESGVHYVIEHTEGHLDMQYCFEEVESAEWPFNKYWCLKMLFENASESDSCAFTIYHN